MSGAREYVWLRRRGVTTTTTTTTTTASNNNMSQKKRKGRTERETDREYVTELGGTYLLFPMDTHFPIGH